ncbi:UNVERIFIED_CONTAM: hypothetical protein Slati_2191100 [Sesamum latifolium]|uniref:Uncharacterized protein n=1 Tax=Sesamum latifolium TaxID=2727402 RepID=A0AAW2WSA4_9LAMI
MNRDVRNFIKTCPDCQQNKYSTHAPYGLLQPLPNPNIVWDEISMDFITHLHNSSGKMVIWVVVDRLSKFTHFIALPTGFTAISLASIFLSKIYRLHGAPRVIVSDRDRVFMIQFWKELFRLLGTTLAFSSSYHPQTDGQTEVLNRCLETYLLCFVSDEPRLWLKFLPLAEFWYSTSYHSSIGMTPIKALYSHLTSATTSFPKAFQEVFQSISHSSPHWAVAYELELPPAACIHPVFHVSLIKPCYGHPPAQISLLPTTPLGVSAPSRPLRILTSRIPANGQKKELLIQWEGLTESEATWEPSDKLQTEFPNFSLEDKASFEGMGNDTLGKPKRVIHKSARLLD